MKNKLLKELDETQDEGLIDETQADLDVALNKLKDTINKTKKKNLFDEAFIETTKDVLGKLANKISTIEEDSTFISSQIDDLLEKFDVADTDINDLILSKDRETVEIYKAIKEIREAQEIFAKTADVESFVENTKMSTKSIQDSFVSVSKMLNDVSTKLPLLERKDEEVFSMFQNTRKEIVRIEADLKKYASTIYEFGASFQVLLEGKMVGQSTGINFKAGSNVSIVATANNQGGIDVTINSTGGGGGTPSLPLNSIQYNNAGAFGGSSDLTWNTPGGSNYLQIGTPYEFLVSGTGGVGEGLIAYGSGTGYSGSLFMQGNNAYFFGADYDENIRWQIDSQNGHAGFCGDDGIYQVDFSPGGSTFAENTISIMRGNIGATADSGKGIQLINNSAAASGAQQVSPALHFQGQGWKTASVAGSQPVDWIAYVLPSQGGVAPGSALRFDASINGGAYTNRFNLSSTGGLSGFASFVTGTLPTRFSMTGSILNLGDTTASLGIFQGFRADYQGHVDSFGSGGYLAGTDDVGTQTWAITNGDGLVTASQLQFIDGADPVNYTRAQIYQLNSEIVIFWPDTSTPMFRFRITDGAFFLNNGQVAIYPQNGLTSNPQIVTEGWQINGDGSGNFAGVTTFNANSSGSLTTYYLGLGGAGLAGFTSPLALGGMPTSPSGLGYGDTFVTDIATAVANNYNVVCIV